MKVIASAWQNGYILDVTKGRLDETRPNSRDNWERTVSLSGSSLKSHHTQVIVSGISTQITVRNNKFDVCG